MPDSCASIALESERHALEEFSSLARRQFLRRGILRSLGNAIAVGFLLTFSPSSAQAAAIFWGNVVTGTIGRANLDGTGVDQNFITLSSLPGSIGIAVDDNFIYWTNSNRGTIGRANLDGTGVNESFISGGSNLRYVAVDGTFIYWTNAAGPATIGRANLDGSGVNQSFITGASLPIGIAVDEAFIYWANATASRIGRANLDGTGVNQSYLLASAFDIEVDGGVIYWTTRFSGVSRANLDGTDRRFLVGASDPLGVAVDPSFVYWTNHDSGTIGRANLDGTEANPNFITGATTPSSVAISLALVCDNGLDDDGDGLSDYPDDPGCTDVADASERGTAVCDDDLDEDDDGIADFPEDPGCADIVDGSELGSAACDNGLDDDLDGLVDWRSDGSGDPDCSSLTDDIEAPPECSDGVDNDSDDRIDLADPDCTDPDDTGEQLVFNHQGWSCGFGPELAVLLPALWWMRRQRAR